MKRNAEQIRQALIQFAPSPTKGDMLRVDLAKEAVYSVGNAFHKDRPNFDEALGCLSAHYNHLGTSLIEPPREVGVLLPYTVLSADKNFFDKNRLPQTWQILLAAKAFALLPHLVSQDMEKSHLSQKRALEILSMFRELGDQAQDLLSIYAYLVVNKLGLAGAIESQIRSGMTLPLGQ